MNIRPRRSVLYMPGSNARALEKAKTLPADAKAEARRQVAQAVKGGGFGRREVIIRINGIGTPWYNEDIGAAIAACPDAILLPKVSTPQRLEIVGQRLIDMEADPKIRIWAMIETALSLFNIRELAAAAHEPETRLTCFVMGTNDLAKETRVHLVPGRAPMVGWLANCVLSAHTYGIDIIDGVYNNLSDMDGFVRECAEGRDLGFEGKTLIHPNQIEPCNQAFSPRADEVALARKMIEAFDMPENQNKGVVQIEGRMVERLHAEMARRTVAIADAIAAQ